MCTSTALRCASVAATALCSLLPQHTGAAGTSEQDGKLFPYLVAQVSKVQGAGGGTIPALHHIAEVGFTAALGLAQVPEVVEEESPLHEDAAGEERIYIYCSQQFTISLLRAQHQKYPLHIQASLYKKSVGNLHEVF